jgi:cytochrome c
MRWSESVSRVLLLQVVLSSALSAQSATYGLGRPATAAEITKWDIAVGREGKELPPGSGTAAEGQQLYASLCAACHGKTGKEGPNDVLVGGQGTLNSKNPVKTVGSYWPYATTVWDYVNRAMPYNRPGSLSANEVYAITAYLLFLNGIVPENEVLNAMTLPKVKMPNRNGFVRDSRPDWSDTSTATPHH